MRLLTELSARSDAAYDNAHHSKLQGRLWGALDGTDYDDRHDADEPPGFCFSLIFPPYDMREGDQRWLLTASPDEELLTHIARDLKAHRELNVGEMSFTVEEVNALAPDVGEPGTRGTLESGTGVLVRIPPWQRENYGIEADHGDSATFWRPEYTMEPFRKQVVANLDRKHGLFAPEYLPGPSETGSELFDEYDLLKTYALPVDVTEGQRMTYVVSKWKLGYTVRDDDHRRHLNLALDCGIGERNALGFGFLNITERTRPGESELEGEDAFA
ncbi:CRISPR-associated endoribonuclease Cas6 [Halococcus sp. IIIV-5B]|uniref:CRISPR-associated endoribonuclease Cas6 n=1 Tax=Halococcus sp. IIIV-5B TaxID=2321230 RepID=UPI000E723EC5|nr:CRISPR-associated endoribonuclease Cas6 [Halococcus sp. IIIV-5B]RJT07553.1 CRISPR-associated endoribonuclease Cas6 [Halococcus sp. IIIV-5B]